jgi:tRNA (guanine26-N2/guanine27-N2)-dimethyltransferase
MMSSTKDATQVRKIPPTIVAPNDMKTITEGSATMLYNSSSEVFYNPVQILNRDLSVTVLRLWDRFRRQNATTKEIKREWAKQLKAESGDPSQPIPPEKLNSYTELPGLKILEALSASGLRSIRYAKEVPNIDEILVNDIDKAAVDCIERNVEFNGLDGDKVKPNIADANDVMFEHRHSHKQFDVVDLDPYGTASPFIGTSLPLSNGLFSPLF